MFSKQEAAALRKQFWISFGKSFPRKWILYNTKIKDVSFKFYANNKQALVCLDIESNDEIKNQLLFDQLGTLKNILQQEYIPAIVFDANYTLENGKTIYRIYAPHQKKFSIYNTTTWQDAYTFFYQTMGQFEMFYLEYEDYIKQAIN
jgi:hypothetical protein